MIKEFANLITAIYGLIEKMTYFLTNLNASIAMTDTQNGKTTASNVLTISTTTVSANPVKSKTVSLLTVYLVWATRSSLTLKMTLTLFTSVATSRLKTATPSLALDARSAKKAISGMTLTTHATIVISPCVSNAMPNSSEKTSSPNALLAKMELHLLPISSNKKRNGESMSVMFQVDR